MSGPTGTSILDHVEVKLRKLSSYSVSALFLGLPGMPSFWSWY